MVVHGSLSSSPGESRALARLTFEELGRGPSGIWAIHRGIAERTFRAVGPGAAVVQVTHDAIAGAFPHARPRLVVFLHGLMETEFSWRLGGGEPYGYRLARDLECTPLYVRYNSGRHISENGRSLDDLMEDLVANWPVEVSEIALVGHSMGGLVARSACHQAYGDEAVWVR